MTFAVVLALGWMGGGASIVTVVEMGQTGNHGSYQRRISGGFAIEVLRDCRTSILNIRSMERMPGPVPPPGGTVDMARVSPDGQYLAMRWRRRGSGDERQDKLLLRNLVLGVAVGDPIGAGRIERIEWDFLGKKVAFESERRAGASIYVLEPGGRPQRRMDLKPGETWCWWNRTNSHLVRIRGQKVLAVEPVGLRVPGVKAEEVLFGPVVGKTGQAAFLTANTLYVGGGSISARYNGAYSLLCDAMLAWSPDGRRLAFQGAGYVDTNDPVEVVHSIAVDGKSWLTKTAGVTDEPPTKLWGWASDNELLVQIGQDLMALDAEGNLRTVYHAAGRILDVSVSEV